MNKQIIAEFNKLIEEIKYEIDNSSNKNLKLKNTFRLSKIKNALNIIINYPKKITKGSDLKDIKGIGSGIMERIDEILQSGKLEEVKLTDKNKNYLKYIEELEQVYGIGRVNAKDFVINHKIYSISALKLAIKNKEIEVSDVIKMGLKYYGKYKELIPRNEILNIDIYLHKILAKVNPDLFGIICGSYRRLSMTSNDIDLLIVHPNIKTINDIQTKTNYLNLFVSALIKDKFICDSLTGIDVNSKYMGFCKYKSNPIRRIDIRYMPYNSYYTALLYFTGNGKFNQNMRQIAKNQNYKLNEYHLLKVSNNKEEIIKINSEKEIFDELNLEYVMPEDRNL